MKIKTFKKLSNALCYSNFEWEKINPPGIVPASPFQKTNILFGENGNGKSKLVDLLKCINNSAPVPKHHDLSGDPQEISITFDGLPDLEYASAWSNSNLKNKFLFFDKTFINGTVHSLGPDTGDTPQRKQQRGRDIIYLGNFERYNYEIEWIDSLRSELRKRNNVRLAQEEAVLDSLVESTSFEKSEVLKEFREHGNDVVDRDSLTSTLSGLKGEISRIETSLKEIDKVAGLQPLAEISIDLNLSNKNEQGSERAIDAKKLFEFSVGDAVTETLTEIEDKKDFIRSGVNLLEQHDKTCPFCAQPLDKEPALTVISNYRAVFDETFVRSENLNTQRLEKYKGLLTGVVGMSAPAYNQVRVRALETYTTPKSSLAEPKLDDGDRAIIDSEIQLCLEKIARPLEKIQSSSSDEVKVVLEKCRSAVQTYNAGVNVLNEQIAQLKKDASEGSLGDKKSELQKQARAIELQLLTIDRGTTLGRYVDVEESCKRNQSVVDQLDKIFSLLKRKIVEEFDTFANNYFQLIAQYVEKISPSMAFLDIKGSPSYDGRSATDPAQCGFKVSYNGKDISGNLSEGERQVIALAFFFAQLSQDPDKDKIIVLDDPITSFDAGKRKSTAELIKEVAEPFQQLFVFTCDPLFKQYLLKSFPAPRNFYYVLKTAGCSAIHYAPNNKEAIFQSFENEFQTINTELGTDENIVVYGQKLRFCLETRIRENYFGAAQDSLDQMLTQVASHPDKFNDLISNKPKIIEIYSYCNTGGLAHYPKDGATSWNELKAKIADYLSLSLL